MAPSRPHICPRPAAGTLSRKSSKKGSHKKQAKGSAAQGAEVPTAPAIARQSSAGSTKVPSTGSFGCTVTKVVLIIGFLLAYRPMRKVIRKINFSYARSTPQYQESDNVTCLVPHQCATVENHVAALLHKKEPNDESAFQSSRSSETVGESKVDFNYNKGKTNRADVNARRSFKEKSVQDGEKAVETSMKDKADATPHIQTAGEDQTGVSAKLLEGHSSLHPL